MSFDLSAVLEGPYDFKDFMRRQLGGRFLIGMYHMHILFRVLWHQQVDILEFLFLSLRDNTGSF